MSTGALAHPIGTHEPFSGATIGPNDRPDTPEVSPEAAVTSAEFRRRFTIDELEKLYDLGFFGDDDRYELIDGDLVDMGRMQPPHASAINRFGREFTLGLGRTASVITQNPMRLSEEIVTQPQPDVTIAKYRKDGYRNRHPFPDDTFLAVEVMETSHRYDREVKLPKYANAGIPVTWLVDLLAQQIEAHRRPVDGVYLDRTILRPGDSIAAEAFPALLLAVSELLGLPEDESES